MVLLNGVEIYIYSIKKSLSCQKTPHGKNRYTMYVFSDPEWVGGKHRKINLRIIIQKIKNEK